MNTSFIEWFEEMEGYSYRFERFYDDVDYAAKVHDYKMLVKWLESSYEMGYLEAIKLYGGTK